jgi:hypothetical protein
MGSFGEVDLTGMRSKGEPIDEKQFREDIRRMGGRLPNTDKVFNTVLALMLGFYGAGVLIDVVNAAELLPNALDATSVQDAAKYFFGVLTGLLKAMQPE